MSELNIEVGRFYKTQDGSKVEILAVTTTLHAMYVGVHHKKSGETTGYIWDADGDPDSLSVGMRLTDEDWRDTYVCYMNMYKSTETGRRWMGAHEFQSLDQAKSEGKDYVEGEENLTFETFKLAEGGGV